MNDGNLTSHEDLINYHINNELSKDKSRHYDNNETHFLNEKMDENLMNKSKIIEKHDNNKHLRDDKVNQITTFKKNSISNHSKTNSESESESETEIETENEMKKSDKRIKMYDLISESEYSLYIKYGIFPYILVIHVIIIIVIVLDTFNISYYNNTYRNHVRVISNKHAVEDGDKLYQIHTIPELKKHLNETITSIFSYSDEFIENINLINKDTLELEFKPVLDTFAPVLINYKIKEGEELPFLKLSNVEMRKVLSQVSEMEINLNYQSDFMEKGLNNSCIFTNIYKYNFDDRAIMIFKVNTNLKSCFKMTYALNFIEKVGLLSLSIAILGIFQLFMIFKKIFQIILFYNKLYSNKNTYAKIRKLSVTDKLGLINKWLILLLVTDVFLILSKF